MGLKANVKKTVGTVCQPFQASGVRSYEAYTWRVRGEGNSYKKRHWERVNCLECRKDLTRGSLAAHRQTQYSMEKGSPGQEDNRKGGGDDPRTYIMEFMAKSGLRTFPVEGCSGWLATRMAMWMQFWNMHV